MHSEGYTERYQPVHYFGYVIPNWEKRGGPIEKFVDSPYTFQQLHIFLMSKSRYLQLNSLTTFNCGLPDLCAIAWRRNKFQHTLRNTGETRGLSNDL